MMTVIYLVPVGRERYELYAEAAKSADGSEGKDSVVARTLRSAREKWAVAVDAARADEAPRSRFLRWRNRLIRHVTEHAAEQHALWNLRHAAAATAVYPSGLDEVAALAIVRAVLTRARQHHRWWACVDAMALAASGLIAPLPGPNLVAYYFAFRVFGHYLSWRGARQALGQTAWTGRAEPALAELGGLAALPQEARERRVELIAERLNLPRLATFFQRTAVPEV
jgi:hypothetical protein